MTQSKLSKNRISQKPQRRGSPKGGHITYRQADWQLFPEMSRIVEQQGGNAFQAALELVRAGQVAGRGTAESKAHRLAKRFLGANRFPSGDGFRRPRARPSRSNREADQNLFVRMHRIMRKLECNVFEAAQNVLGGGSSKTKAQHLATRFRDFERAARKRAYMVF
jgi:hypothetical protein